MVSAVYEFFGIIEVSPFPPQTMGELIPYFLTVFVGLTLTLAVFRVIGGIVEALITAMRRM